MQAKSEKNFRQMKYFSVIMSQAKKVEVASLLKKR
jgi:hypothetical protein